jgi:pyruvate,water dikinase
MDPYRPTGNQPVKDQRPIFNLPFDSGIPAVNQVSSGLRVGDNVVWRINEIQLYQEVCQALVHTALKRPDNAPIVYFRFANHLPLLDTHPRIRQVQVEPQKGFENFISQIHQTISGLGLGGVYVFDSLSDLQQTYYSDRMIGNFFVLTCPYLRSLETVAYFSLSWGVHSSQAVDPIRNTTQVWFDGYLHNQVRYLQGIKTREGMGKAHHSILFRWLGGNSPAEPVRNSALESAVRSSASWMGLPSSPLRRVDVWDQVFTQFQNLLDQLEMYQQEEKPVPQSLFDRHDQLRSTLISMILTNDPKLVPLVERHISSRQMLAIWKRMVGSGFIGGKALGMLLARSILVNRRARMSHIFEDHDSFYIGSDVYYTYLVQNNCWWDRLNQKHPDNFLEQNTELLEKVMEGSFSDQIMASFRDILDYYGESPIIIRSSSLLEDNYGNAFAGKYDSVFCTNQGTMEERLAYFCWAVKHIYSGTMAPRALEYRKSRGVLDKDEQMALLVQRVSGRRRGSWFFPDLAGTLLSYNPYAWHPEIDPQAGMARIVVGLGTRAVDRVAKDHPWVVSLNAPQRTVEHSTHGYQQELIDSVDLLATEAEQVVGEISLMTPGGLKNAEDLEIPEFLFDSDWRKARLAKEQGLDPIFARTPSLKHLWNKTELATILREACEVLSQEYGTHVEVEFTAQWDHRWDGENPCPWINLLQCRPFQMKVDAQLVPQSHEPPKEQILLRLSSPVIGRGRQVPIHAMVWIDPQTYSKLSEQHQYKTAEDLHVLLQQITQNLKEREHLQEDEITIMLIGPGRWGTSTPSMGVPAQFSQIRHAQILGELDWMHKDLSPDLSLGTHFFHDLVEADMVFLGLRQSDPELIWAVEEAYPDFLSWGPGSCIRYLVHNSPEVHQAQGSVAWRLYADPQEQKAMVYWINPE